MPPLAGSRYSFCQAFQDEQGRWLLTDREPYRFHEHADNRVHIVAEGDTLFELAGRYFAPLPRACGYWWAIADFQPTAIIDPSLRLEPASKIHIPSQRVLTDVILADPRRRTTT
jgi:hypothetical protein